MREQNWFLKNSLIGNAIFSFFCGLVMIFWDDWLSEYVGLTNPLILIFIGVGLLVFSFGLGMISRIRIVQEAIIWSIVALDFLWVIGSGILIYINILTSQGNVLTVIVAGIVLIFANMQMIGIRKSNINEE